MIGVRASPNGRWLVIGVAALAVVLLVSGIALWRAHAYEGPPTALPWCRDQLGEKASERSESERNVRERIYEGAGAPSGVAEIADWDPTVTWAFRIRTYNTAYEGLFQASDKLDVTHTQLDWLDHPATLVPARRVVLGREVWSDDPNLPGPPPKREHCELAPQYVMGYPLKVAAVMHAPESGLPGTIPLPVDTFTLIPGTRLSVEPGKPTTVDGEPGTAYVWSSAEDPQLRAEFVLDQRNQLRSATVTDTSTNTVVAEMSAHPTDARIQRPDWTVP